MPLLTIVAQLNQSITVEEMLKFLVVAMCAFTVGHLLQRLGAGHIQK